jgi:hypothetical protein
MKRILTTFSLFSFLFIVTAVANTGKPGNCKKSSRHNNHSCETGISKAAAKIIS